MLGWNRSKVRAIASLCGVGLLACGGVVVGLSAPAGATHSPPALQVGCSKSSYTTITAALAAAPAGATINVCAGTYKEGVTISKAVTLVGKGATIDATGVDTGVAVLASKVSVSGFTVMNATGEGILVKGAAGAPATGVTLLDNIVTHNDLGNATGQPLTSSPYPECNAGANDVPGDCGEGIHLMSADQVTVEGNVVYDDTGGILVTDELGPADHDVITQNQVFANPYDCGITLAGHQMGTATTTVAAQKGGVFDNVVSSNLIVGNGIRSQGGGVLLATGAPGGAVYDNTVSGNVLSGNGLGGVTVHSHLPKAAENLNGNVVENNVIQTNNLTPDQDFTPYVDSETTGVVVASLSPLSITVRHNTIGRNTYGIWAMPAVTFVGGISSNRVASPSQPLCMATPADTAFGTPSGCTTGP